MLTLQTISKKDFIASGIKFNRVNRRKISVTKCSELIGQFISAYDGQWNYIPLLSGMFDFVDERDNDILNLYEGYINGQ